MKNSLTFHGNCLLWRQFARNVKLYFLGEIKKKYINLSSAAFACRFINLYHNLLKKKILMIYNVPYFYSNFWDRQIGANSVDSVQIQNMASDQDLYYLPLSRHV